MRALISVFSGITLCMMLGVSCTTLPIPSDEGEFSLSVVDVGGGLSQIGAIGGEAVVLDMGDSGYTDNWTGAYQSAGSPFIRAIVISQSSGDHMGGIKTMPDSIPFSGEIVTSAVEDTALIRENCGSWASRVRFLIVAQGDTIDRFNGVSVVCLWPPGNANSAAAGEKDDNAFSLCCIVRYQSNAALLTSDIDTVAERTLAAQYGFSLKSDLIVVPDHGADASVNPVFFGYADPSIAVISCSANNPNGYPSALVLALLYQMRMDLYQTGTGGTITARSNGYYWTVEKEFTK